MNRWIDDFIQKCIYTRGWGDVAFAGAFVVLVVTGLLLFFAIVLFIAWQPLAAIALAIIPLAIWIYAVRKVYVR